MSGGVCRSGPAFVNAASGSDWLNACVCSAFMMIGEMEGNITVGEVEKDHRDKVRSAWRFSVH